MPTPETVDLSNCAREPIHTPGKIQAHGFLLALEPVQLTIIQASSNAGHFIGCPAGQLLGSRLRDLIGKKPFAAIASWLEQPSFSPINPLPVVFNTNGSSYNAVLHLAGKVLVIECEVIPETPLLSYSELYYFLNQSIKQFHQLHRPSDFYNFTTRQIKHLTGYDRVMLYRFDQAYNGEVIAESCNPDVEKFLGLHYPASDIPVQARELYLKNWIRIIPDVGYEPASLVALSHPLNQAPLDLTHSVLRSVSPIHVEYLQNMGVKATLTISLIKENKLWGLIACHHYQPRFLDYLSRTTAEIIGQVFSHHLSLREESEHHVYARQIKLRENLLVEQISRHWHIPKGLTEHAITFLSLCECSGGAICYDGQLQTMGCAPGEEAVRQLIDWLNQQEEDVFCTDHLSAHFPAGDALKSAVSGLLSIRISRQLGEYILWFKPEVVRTVTWGGNPDKPAVWDKEKLRLSPRKSFEKWQQKVLGQSTPWKTAEIETVRKLREHLIDMVMRFMAEMKRMNQELEKARRELEGRVRERTQELELLNEQLKIEILERQKAEQSLRHAKEMAEEMYRLKTHFLANMSHEIRTPINGIVGLANIIEDELGENETIQYYLDLQKQSGERLLNTITSILEMARLESQNTEFKLSEVNLSQEIRKILPILQVLAQKKKLFLRFEEPARQAIVHVDEVLFGQVINNLIGNAIKFTEQGGVTVSLALLEEAGKHKVSLRVTDTGIGISPGFLRKLFSPFQQESSGLNRKFEGSGLGLSIVKRYVELFGGSIHVESTKGQGSTFEVKLPLVKSI